MWHHLQTPASPDDVFELPASSPRKASQKKKHKRKKRHIAKKITASICLGLSLMAPVASYAATDNLYISGGGGGASSEPAKAEGGTHAGYGGLDTTTNVRNDAGGAYIGNGISPASGKTGSKQYFSYTALEIKAENGGDAAPYQGGSATLKEVNLTNFETIFVEAGDGGVSNDTSYSATVGKGGDATLIITGIMKGNLYLQDGEHHLGYAISNDGGKARATIHTWDASEQNTTFTNDQTEKATIEHLILGNSRVFTITNTNDNYSINQYSVYDNAEFQGTFNAQNKTINFNLSEYVTDGSTMLTVNGDAHIDNSTVKMAFSGSTTTLVPNDEVILIDVTGTLSGQQSNRTASAVPQGASLIYNFTLETGGSNQLIATLASTGAAPVKVNPKTKAFSQERLAQLAFITQGADLVNQGVMNAMLGLSPDFAYDVVPFFIGQGGKSRYETGSHIDVDGMALTTGLAWRGQTTYGFPILAAFFEAGWGNFKTSLDSSHEDASGKGDLSYYGAGLLGHMDFNPLGPGSFYAEGSVRTGYSYGDFHTRNIRDGFGRTADFESSAPYYGLHVGLGYRLKFNELLGMELYSKYFWTHLAADEVNILGDPFEFDALDSQRWRNGLRLSFYIPTQNYMLQPFVGVAYEHEFAGTASGSVHGYTMEEPSIKGGSGIGEIGLSLYPTDHAGLSLDVAVSGYTGRREGVSGDIRLKWEF